MIMAIVRDIKLQLNFDHELQYDDFLKLEDNIFGKFNIALWLTEWWNLINDFRAIDKLYWIEYKVHESKISLTIFNYFIYRLIIWLSWTWLSNDIKRQVRNLFSFDYKERFFWLNDIWKNSINDLKNLWKHDFISYNFNLFALRSLSKWNDSFYEKMPNTMAYRAIEWRFSNMSPWECFWYNINKRKTPVFEYLLLLVLFFDIQLYLVIKWQWNFCIINESSLNKFFKTWAYVLDLSNILAEICDSVLRNPSCNGLDDDFFANSEVRKSNLNEAFAYLKDFIGRYPEFQNLDIVMKAKDWEPNFMEINTKTDDLDAYKWEKELSWYKEITKVYEKNDVKSLKIKTKKKFD